MLKTLVLLSALTASSCALAHHTEGAYEMKDEFQRTVMVMAPTSQWRTHLGRVVAPVLHKELDGQPSSGVLYMPECESGAGKMWKREGLYADMEKGWTYFYNVLWQGSMGAAIWIHICRR
jgi:hypothetical protein